MCLAASRWQPFTAFGHSATMFDLRRLWLYALPGLAWRAGSGLGPMFATSALGLATLWPLALRCDAFKRETAPTSVWRFFGSRGPARPASCGGAAAGAPPSSGGTARRAR